MDPKLIISEKLQEALKHHQGEFIVDDQSFYVDSLNGLPGPLIKWFLRAMGAEGIAKMVKAVGNNTATVSTIIGYAKNAEEIHFFEGSSKGSVVEPRGKGGFGWDPIFLPSGSNQTFGEWKETHEGPNAMRLEALNKLKEFLKA